MSPSVSPCCPVCGLAVSYGRGPTLERRQLVAAMRLKAHALQAHGLNAEQFATIKRQESA